MKDKGYPPRVTVVEVGPRDGFQNVKSWIPTEVKLAVIDKLLGSGFRRIELTSFVHPKAIPQMADAEQIAAEMAPRCRNAGIEPIALVPNLTGARRAAACGITTQTFVLSVSERHNYENTKMSVQQSLQELKKIRENLPDVNIRVALATAFGCPFQGPVPVGEVIDLIGQAREIGAAEVLLCDTIGVANPRQVEEVITTVGDRYPLEWICLHLHDTRGMGLANATIAMRCGVTAFETAAAGLGGCPFAPGAAGNIATEDFVNMCQEMGIETGIGLKKVMDAVGLIRDGIENRLASHLANVCLGDRNKL